MDKRQTEDNVRKDNDNVVKGSGEVEGSNGKDAKVPIKVILMPRPLPPFPRRLVKKTEDGKYQHVKTMLKKIFINVPFIKALEQMPGCAKFMKDLVTKKDRSLLRTMIECNIVVLLIQDL